MQGLARLLLTMNGLQTAYTPPNEKMDEPSLIQRYCSFVYRNTVDFGRCQNCGSLQVQDAQSRARRPRLGGDADDSECGQWGNQEVCTQTVFSLQLLDLFYTHQKFLLVSQKTALYPIADRVFFLRLE